MHKTILCNYGNPMHDPPDGGAAGTPLLFEKNLSGVFSFHPLFFSSDIFFHINYVSIVSYTIAHLVPRMRNYFTRSRVTTETISHDREWWLFYFFIFIFSALQIRSRVMDRITPCVILRNTVRYTVTLRKQWKTIWHWGKWDTLQPKGIQWDTL
jgi:hypothetical protein